MYREEWLHKATDLLRPYFSDRGYEIPEQIRVSCGWPSSGGLTTKRRKLGECWKSESATDGIRQIFISPYLADDIDVLGVLVHELLHACLPDDAGHKKPFKEGMRALGMEGHATSTTPGLLLRAHLEGLELEKYPNSKVDRVSVSKTPSTGRMRKLYCPANEEHEDDYIIRTVKKNIEIGLPTCVCGKQFIYEESEEE